MAGRTLAIGDIHGCDFALAALLKQVDPTGDDTVVLLGDVMDRGGGSKQALDLLRELAQSVRLIYVRGNHEEMMLMAVDNRQWRESWLRYGGSTTLFSYGGRMDDVPASHWEFIQSSVDFHETPLGLFIHANLQPGVPLERQTTQWLRWTHLSGEETPLPTGQRVFCGHTPQKSGLPLHRPGWVCLDTYACGNGWLTALDVGSGQVYQANEKRQTRESSLPPPEEAPPGE